MVNWSTTDRYRSHSSSFKPTQRLLHAKLSRHKQCAAFNTMSFPALSSPAFSTPAVWCQIFRSHVFHPCILVPHFPVLHFPSLQSGAAFSGVAFSILAFSAAPRRLRILVFPHQTLWQYSDDGVECRGGMKNRDFHGQHLPRR